MMKIWGRLNSINVQKVVWTADELGLAYERIDAGGAFGRTKTPDFVAMNPNALVPVLEDDDTVLWESNTIVRYLAAKYGDGVLTFSDPAARARAEMWMDWQSTTLNPAMTPMFFGLIRHKPEERDAAAIEASRERTVALFQIVDRHLATSPYIGGDRFTVADIPLGCAANRYLKLPIERPSLPALQAWYENLSKRPSSHTAMAVPLT